VTAYDVSQHVSVDDHLVEVPDLWECWLPSKFRDRAPRVVAGDSADAWTFEDRRYPVCGTAVLRRDKAPIGHDVTYEDIRPGCYDPKAPLADLDFDGIAASLCFPLMPGFCSNRFSAATDKDARPCVHPSLQWLYTGGMVRGGSRSIYTDGDLAAL
jgi:hypothetical protein